MTAKYLPHSTPKVRPNLSLNTLRAISGFWVTPLTFWFLLAHCTYTSALSSVKLFPMTMRSFHCVFSLSHCQYELYKRSFVLRILFAEAYWLYLLYFYITATYCSFISCFIFVFSVYSMFDHNGVFLSCVSCNKMFIYLLTYLVKKSQPSILATWPKRSLLCLFSNVSVKMSSTVIPFLTFVANSAYGAMPFQPQGHWALDHRALLAAFCGCQKRSTARWRPQ